MANLGVETTQHVQLNYTPSGITERILAYILDGIILGAYWVFILTLGLIGNDATTPPVDVTTSDEYVWVAMLIIMLPVFLYHLIIEVLWNGYSVGKWLMGIRVVMLDGTRPNLSNYLIRWLIRLFEITLTSGGIALITILINGKGQRLGDIAAKTCVIKVRRKTKFSDTVFEDFNEGYEPVFQQVMELNDKDISIVNEVLKAKRKYEYGTWIELVAKTRAFTQEKMGVSTTNLKDTDFLKQIVKDYNALNGILE